MPVMVLDASVALAAVFPETNSEAAEAILARIVDGGALVPALWRLEVGNALLIAERRGTIAAGDHNTLLVRLGALPITVDLETSARAWDEIIDLAQRHRLTLYDAAYLELSVRRSLPLATFDAALRRASAAANVELP
jgi:predicted nucleic acid-binding protein